MKNIVILFTLFTVFSCTKSKEEKPIRQDIKELVFASGQLEWDDSYNLAAQTDGVLKSANFDVGKMVNKGAVIAEIENQTNQIMVFRQKSEPLICPETKNKGHQLYNN